MEQLEGRTAAVTGAASGIGLAIVEAFVPGHAGPMADIDEEGLQAHAARPADPGASVFAVTADVRDPDALERVGSAAVEHFGKLHVAVNNAGVVTGGYSWEIPLEDWHRVIDIDLWGVIHGIRAFVPRILASGDEGHVVNTASMAAVLALGRLGPYTVAKHGVLGLSDVFRAEFEALAVPVGVSVVMPGMIRTAMNPIGTVTPATCGAPGGRCHPAGAPLRLHRRPQHGRSRGPPPRHPLSAARSSWIAYPSPCRKGRLTH